MLCYVCIDYRYRNGLIDIQIDTKIIMNGQFISVLNGEVVAYLIVECEFNVC
jgi:hypothetical protein